MRRKIEVSFITGGSDIILADTWDEINILTSGFVEIKSNGETFALYPSRNIKSIVMLEDVEHESEKRGEESGDLEGTQGRQDAEGYR